MARAWRILGRASSWDGDVALGPSERLDDERHRADRRRRNERVRNYIYLGTPGRVRIDHTRAEGESGCANSMAAGFAAQTVLKRCGREGTWLLVKPGKRAERDLFGGD